MTSAGGRGPGSFPLTQDVWDLETFEIAILDSTDGASDAAEPRTAPGRHRATLLLDGISCSHSPAGSFDGSNSAQQAAQPGAAGDGSTDASASTGASAAGAVVSINGNVVPAVVPGIQQQQQHDSSEGPAAAQHAKHPSAPGDPQGAAASASISSGNAGGHACAAPSTLQLLDFSAFMLPEECTFTESSLDDALMTPTPHTPMAPSIFAGEGLPVVSARTCRPHYSSSNCGGAGGSSSANSSSSGGGCSSLSGAGSGSAPGTYDAAAAAAGEGGGAARPSHDSSSSSVQQLGTCRALLMDEGDDEFELDPFPAAVLNSPSTQGRGGAGAYHVYSGLEMLQAGGWEAPPFTSLLCQRSLSTVSEAPNEGVDSESASRTQSGPQAADSSPGQQQQQVEEEQRQQQQLERVPAGDSDQECDTQQQCCGSVGPAQLPAVFPAVAPRVAPCCSSSSSSLEGAAGSEQQQQEAEQLSQQQHQQQQQQCAASEPDQGQQQAREPAADHLSAVVLELCSDLAEADSRPQELQPPAVQEGQPAQVQHSSTDVNTAAAVGPALTAAPAPAPAPASCTASDTAADTAADPAEAAAAEAAAAAPAAEGSVAMGGAAVVDPAAPSQGLQAPDSPQQQQQQQQQDNAAVKPVSSSGSSRVVAVTATAAAADGCQGEDDVWEAANKQRLAQLSLQEGRQVLPACLTYPEAEAQLLAAVAAAAAAAASPSSSPSQQQQQQRQLCHRPGLLQRLLLCGCSSAGRLPGGGLQPQQQCEQVMQLAKTPFDNDSSVHQALLQAVWQAYNAGSSAGPAPRLGPHWAALGFQGDDPATDLRGAGVLGLLQLLYLQHHDAAAAAQILKLSQSPEQEFPLAIVSLNVTAWTCRALRARQLDRPAGQLGGHMAAANRFYCGAMYEFYSRRLEGKKTMVESGLVLKQLERYCSSHCKQLLQLAAGGEQP